MTEAQEVATNTIGLADEDRSVESQNKATSSSRVVKKYKWWIKIAMFTFFVLSGQSVATMLGRLYFNGGGNSKWMATLVQTAGFPLMFPLIFIDSEQSVKTSRSKYIIGFVCTVAASAGYGLMLSVTQVAFKRILKSESYKVVFDVIVYQNMVASVAILVGLFASGEWNDIKGEMEGYKLGPVSYIMNLVWTAITWQVFSIGCIGLIFEVSSLFSNVISTLGIPIVPVLAVVFFHEKMNGVKVIAMLLAIWGFTSYIYQHYLDDLKEKGEARYVNRQVDLVETRIN